MPLPRESPTPASVLPSVARLVRALIWVCLKCGIRMRYPDVATMDVAALQTLLDGPSSTGWLILDARTLAEFNFSHLSGAVPLDAGTTMTDGEIEEMAGSKNRPILVVCSVGVRSAKQALKLQRQGFLRVTHLEGGLFEWVNQGHRLVDQGDPVRKVHPYGRIWGLLLHPPHE